MGMPVEVFVQKTWPEIVSGTDHIVIGSIGTEESFMGTLKQRRDEFENLSNLMLSHFEL